MRPEPRWPGLDGWSVIAVTTAAWGTWFLRGRLGGEDRLLLLALLAASWLGLTFLGRRRRP